MGIESKQQISVSVYNQKTDIFEPVPMNEQYRYRISTGYTIIVWRDVWGHRTAIAVDDDGKPVSIGL